MTQSFAFAVFATLICQINIVFPCKDTKAAKSCAFCVIRFVPNSWIVCFVFVAQSFSLWHRARVLHPNHGTEPVFFVFFHRTLTQNTNFQLYISYTQPAKRRKSMKTAKTGCRLPRNLLHKQYGTPYETR